MGPDPSRSLLVAILGACVGQVFWEEEVMSLRCQPEEQAAGAAPVGQKIAEDTGVPSVKSSLTSSVGVVSTLVEPCVPATRSSYRKQAGAASVGLSAVTQPLVVVTRTLIALL
jgi:hypothetical protein